jgi:hypothetical protein
MSKILNTTAVVISVSIGFAAMGSAPALATWHPVHAHHGYAGPVPSSVSHTALTIESVPQFVPGRGIVGESCDLPSSACPNNERISN